MPYPGYNFILSLAGQLSVRTSTAAAVVGCFEASEGLKVQVLKIKIATTCWGHRIGRKCDVRHMCTYTIQQYKLVGAGRCYLLPGCLPDVGVIVRTTFFPVLFPQLWRVFFFFFRVLRSWPVATAVRTSTASRSRAGTRNERTHAAVSSLFGLASPPRFQVSQPLLRRGTLYEHCTYICMHHFGWKCKDCCVFIIIVLTVLTFPSSVASCNL